MDKDIIGSCDGCVDNSPNNGAYNGIPDCYRKKLIESCPCKICLIKVMCNKACEEFVEYSKRNKNKSIDIR